MNIKVFSFNLRVNVECDGINAFPNRKKRIVSTVREYSPDLIGFQEVTYEMRTWLIDTFSEYSFVGCGREKDLGGESTLIAYKKDAFEAIKTETFWLSATPSVPGSRYGFDQSICPRTATSALLYHIPSGKKFVFCNTHLDHMGANARLFGSMQIMQYLSENAEDFILTGDFNAPPQSPEVSIITEAFGSSVRDATFGMGGTFHDFGKLSEERKYKIDYIFTNLPFEIEKSIRIPDTGIDGVYISDHHPICAEIELR